MQKNDRALLPYLSGCSQIRYDIPLACVWLKVSEAITGLACLSLWLLRERVSTQMPQHLYVNSYKWIKREKDQISYNKNYVNILRNVLDC